MHFKKKTQTHTYRKEKGFALVCPAVQLSSIMMAALERKNMDITIIYLPFINTSDSFAIPIGEERITWGV